MTTVPSEAGGSKAWRQRGVVSASSCACEQMGWIGSVLSCVARTLDEQRVVHAERER